MPKAGAAVFSLGNKEAKTKNPVMKTVEEKTKELHRWYKEQGIPVVYEEKPGNPFSRMPLIAWQRELPGYCSKSCFVISLL